MTNKPDNLNSEVKDFLDQQNHPLRKEIEELRIYILSTDKNLTENIKWNGPNFCFNSEDRITMKINPPNKLQLIFHRGAKKQEQPKKKLINENSKLLIWKENDRAIATFKSMADIEKAKSALTNIVNLWISASQ